MTERIALVALIVLVGAHFLAPFDEIQTPQPQPKAETADIRELKLRDWEPKSMMVTKTTIVEKPLYPVIDVHNHLGGGKERLTPATVKRYLTEMDEAGVKTVVNLDGGWGGRLKETLAALDEAHPGRFLTFALINFDGLDDPKWGEREAARLEESFAAGAKGLKFHKTLGLAYRYKDGRLMTVDDPQLDPVWEMCAKHGRPVVIHIADPAAFFTPLDRFNERWHELNQHPNWLFFGEKFPKRQDLLDQLHRVIAKHPKTTFINTHFGNNAEDLASVADKLDKYPNMYVDFDARISELGRQPYTARKFFIKYQDRILFGTDTNPRREAFRIYYRFLETEDEYFDCSASHHRQGFWNIYGIHLPPEVLDKIYRRNAERSALRAEAEPGQARPARDEGEVHRGLRGQRQGRREGVGEGRVGAAPPPHREGTRLRDEVQGAPFEEGSLRPDGGGRQETHREVREGLREPLDRGRVRGLPLDRRARPALLRVRDLAPRPRTADHGAQQRRPVHGLAAVALRGRRARSARRPRRMGGEVKSGAEVKGWRAEVFIPYELLNPLRNIPPKPGTRWRANFYRMDYDDGRHTGWDWSRVGPSFHEYQKFGTLVFE